MSARSFFRAIALICLSVSFATGTLASGTSIPNWPVANVRTGGSGAFAIGDPGLFVSILPCRVTDTRATSGMTGQYGPPSLPGVHAQRDFTITGQCGIPAFAQAVSFNFTVWAPVTRGDLRVFPQGAAIPNVATLNWEANIQALANAAVVPLGINGGITVQVDGPGTIDLIFDVNGYFFDKDGAVPAGTPTTPRYLSVSGVVDPVAGLPYSVLFAENHSTGVAYSIKADISNTNTGSAAIAGLQLDAGTGVNYGVLGKNASTSESSAGVRGESTGGGYGVYAAGNFAASGSKSFVEPHPTDPSLVIRYVAMEGPESGTYFRGRSSFEHGSARIPVPEDFRIVTAPDGLTVHVTPIGAPATTWVARISLDQIIVQSTRDVEFSYVVYGVRKAFRDHAPIAPGSEFMPDSPSATMPAWLTDEARRRLIANGTYNEDGTVNMATARKVGWVQAWHP